MRWDHFISFGSSTLGEDIGCRPANGLALRRRAASRRPLRRTFSSCIPGGAAYRQPARRHGRNNLGRTSAYTLIEILVSIAILSLMVVAIARIVTDMTKATKAGHRQAYDDANARAVMDMIVDDLTQAVNEPSINMFRLRKNDTTYSPSLLAHDLQFVAALGPKLDPTRPGSGDKEADTLKTVRYYMDVDPIKDSEGYDVYRLCRGEEWGVLGQNENAAGYPVLEFLVEFRVTMYDEQRKEIPGPDLDYLPAFVNIYFSVISEDDHRRASRIQKQGGDMTTYVHKNAHRYFTQAFIPVRNGRKTEYNY